MKRLKIAYLTLNDPHDKRSWSGITYYLAKTLERNIGDVEMLGPVKLPWLLEKYLRAFAKLTRIFSGKEYSYKYSLVRAWYASRILQHRFKKGKFDFVIAPASSDGLAFFKTNVPIVYMADTTFRLIRDYYTWEFEKISSISRKEGEFLERQSLKKSSLLLYTSNWAASSAITDYKVPKNKIQVITMGANIDSVPDPSIIYDKENNKTLTLFYLAVEWERKGGAIAYDALLSLLEAGIDSQLIVCGCIPPPHFHHPAVKVIPFLNKNNKSDHDQFIELLSSVHFLLLPTRADCSLLVACESNSYGVPAITTLTGGVPDVVKDGVNGYCLPVSAQGNDYASLISEIFFDKKRYHELIRTSRLQFDQQLNWDKWAERFLQAYQSKTVAKTEV
ncbi:glycosyltransferase family 4 protein [Flavitalea antarctica]